MKKNYQKPSVKAIHITIQEQLLNVSGFIGDDATMPAKGRGDSVWDDDEWDFDDDSGDDSKALYDI